MSPYDIKTTKEILAWRFRYANRVEGTREDWYRYLLKYQETERRDSLLKKWSSLWQKANAQGITVQSVWYNVPLDELEKRIKYLKGMVK